jgi:tetratricopeptide (TPR) repeat protein
VEGHAARAQELAERLEAGEYFSEIWMWRAHVGFMLGETEAAQDFFKRAIDRFLANGLLPAENFFAAWRLTYWRFGNFEKALQLVEDEEKWIEGNGQIAREARLARIRCHLKLILGTVETTDFEAAHAKIALLGDPSHEAGRLEEVENAWKNQPSPPTPERE